MADKPERVNVDVDAPLVERVKRGDQRAFEMLVVKYQRRVERLIARMVRDTDLVPDIAQETFIRAYRALPNFRGDSAFYTWLYRIAVNTAKKALMELKRDPLVTQAALASREDEDETSRVENELSDGETPESLMASKQIAQEVNAAVEALSEDLRQAITLREIEGLSYEDIAEVMNCPIGTVLSPTISVLDGVASASSIRRSSPSGSGFFVSKEFPPYTRRKASPRLSPPRIRLLIRTGLFVRTACGMPAFAIARITSRTPG